jgi:polar amino acid transport system substrate-binding protein
LRVLGQRLSDGSVEVMEAPDPVLQPGCLLVRTLFSAVSPGTEGGKVRAGRMNLLQKARSRPEQVGQVLAMVRSMGLASAVRKVRARLEGAQPLGYSLCGVVEAVGEGAGSWRKGDLAACAGGGWASHAELASVPAILCAKVPGDVPPEDAAFATLAAVAMQGVRLAAPAAGESAMVIGLGVIGQLACQILRAHGCRVLGVDLDRAAVSLALSSGGADAAADSSASDPAAAAEALSRGRGIDLVLICAGTDSDEPVRLAGAAARKRGRVVVVGAVGMDLPREDYYLKELAFSVSCSYGPGRYDPSYEEYGLDYPLPFVRWTEGRNLEAVLDLMAAGTVRPSALVTHRVPLEEAPAAYDMIAGSTAHYCGILLTYGGDRARVRSVDLPASRPVRGDALSVSFCGAGSFAQTFLIPSLARDRGVRLDAICTRTGLTSADAGRRFGFSRAVSSIDDILDSPGDAVFIATRHDLHGPLAARVLGAGRHVFVEKPLCLDREELAAMARILRGSEAPPVLAAGFNRRFSPAAAAALGHLAGTGHPVSIVCTVAAGRVPMDHWTQDPRQGGGRIVGEACHFVDLMQYLAGAPPVSVRAVALDRQDASVPARDNSMLLFEFGNGSTGVLSYLADASPRLPKERIEASSAGRTAIIHNFTGVELLGRTRRTVAARGKGHDREIAAFTASLRTGIPPVPFREIAAATLATFAAEESLASGLTVPIDVDRFLADA